MAVDIKLSTLLCSAALSCYGFCLLRCLRDLWTDSGQFIFGVRLPPVWSKENSRHGKMCPRPLSRTKKYQSFINFGLNNYQSPVTNT